jgi:hypothetical protein
MKGLIVVSGGFSDDGESFCASIAGDMSLHAVAFHRIWVVGVIERAMDG